EITTRYPGAYETTLSELALAEIAFAQKRLDEVVARCNRVIARGHAPERASALYLKAWSLRGIGDSARPGATREAMAALGSIVRMAPRIDPRLARAAERDLSSLQKEKRGGSTSL